MMAGRVGLNTLMGSPPDVGVAETKYPVIVEPPVDGGGSALTDVLESPAVYAVLRFLGGPGVRPTTSA